jgi:hypothetical protein
VGAGTPGVLRRLRENGPIVLVPLAWAFVTAAHVDLVRTRTLLIAHVVMTVLLVGFAALSYRDMREGVLNVWWLVIAAGVPVTLCGLVGLAVPAIGRPLLPVAVVGWMVLPGVALWYTGRESPTTGATRLYLVAGACSLLGGAVYLGGLFVAGGLRALLAGLALAGAGQTAGIVHAVVRY